MIELTHSPHNNKSRRKGDLIEREALFKNCELSYLIKERKKWQHPQQ